MGCSVRELLARMDSREISEWQAYYSIDPFGEERADLRAGIVASVIANVNRTKQSNAFNPSDFMPYYEKPEQTQAVQKAVVQLMMTAMSKRKDT